jgi:subtilisin family serine protease
MSYVHLPPYRVDFSHVPLTQQDGVDWAVEAYGIPALWRSTQGEGVTVAVIDSGCCKHPALNDTVVDHRNFSSDSDVFDTLGHGTHVCGVIGARTGLAQGVAHQCRILSLKVLGHSGMGSNEAVATAVRHATEAQVDVICMSLGSSRPDDRVHKSIQRAVTAGITVVCAAGNDGGSVNYPAAFEETVAVGAVDRENRVCEFSSRGREITVAAPGQDITSTWLAGGYATISGTSMAAPFVTGVVALYMSGEKKNGRKPNPTQVLKAISDTCRDAGVPGHDERYGWGLVDPHKLLAYEVRAQQDGVTIFIPGARIL